MRIGPHKKSREWGYRLVVCKGHPRASRSNCVTEHVLVAERALGGYLPDGAEVHHVDGDKRNNVGSNLVICEGVAYHKLLHQRARVVGYGGNPNTDLVCCVCKTAKPFDAFALDTTTVNSGRSGRCRECSKHYDYARKEARRANRTT